MSIVVFWVNEQFPNIEEPRFQRFQTEELTAALGFCQYLRNQDGVSHVCLSSENPNSVGKPGVDTVKDGRTPDGEVYDWVKRR